MTENWKKKDKPWPHYPIGTIAKQMPDGTTWVKTERGWELTTNGALFSRPCNADLVRVPEGVENENRPA